MSDDYLTDMEWERISLPRWEELIQKPSGEIRLTIDFALRQLLEVSETRGEAFARRTRRILPKRLRQWLVRRDDFAAHYAAEARAASDKAEVIRITHRYVRKYLPKTYALDPDPEIYVRTAGED